MMLEKLIAETLSDKNCLPINKGSHGCGIFRGGYGDRDSILKIGRSDTKSGLEIRFNLLAYEEMKELKVFDLIAPEIFESGNLRGFDYLIMEYAGPDFLSSVDSESIMNMTINLIKTLRRVYEVSRNVGSPLNWLAQKFQKIKRCFIKYLAPRGLLKEEEMEKLANLYKTLTSTKYRYTSWATADIKPDNVRISNGRIKIIDQKPSAKGIPLIDLAMFATFTKYVLALPRNEEVYLSLVDFSREVAEDLRIQEEVEKRLFLFGELYQLILSSRADIEDRSKTEYFSDIIALKLKDTP